MVTRSLYHVVQLSIICGKYVNKSLLVSCQLALAIGVKL